MYRKLLQRGLVLQQMDGQELCVRSVEKHYFIAELEVNPAQAACLLASKGACMCCLWWHTQNIENAVIMPTLTYK